MHDSPHATEHCRHGRLASQKHYTALYLVSVYSDPELAAWFKKAYAASGKKLDMGKSCVRFKTPDALPLEKKAPAKKKPAKKRAPKTAPRKK